MIAALCRMWVTTWRVLRIEWKAALLTLVFYGFAVYCSHIGAHWGAAGAGLSAGVMFSIILNTAWEES